MQIQELIRNLSNSTIKTQNNVSKKSTSILTSHKSKNCVRNIDTKYNKNTYIPRTFASRENDFDLNTSRILPNFQESPMITFSNVTNQSQDKTDPKFSNKFSADIISNFKTNMQNKIVDSVDQYGSMLKSQQLYDPEIEKQLHDLEIEKEVETKFYENELDKQRNELSVMKQELFRTKEKIEERKRQFEADKNTYYKIKADVDNDKITNIPILFRDRYNLYQFLDNKDLLESSNYHLYRLLYNVINSVENDIEVLPEDKLLNEYNDIISEFISNEENYTNNDSIKIGGEYSSMFTT